MYKKLIPIAAAAATALSLNTHAASDIFLKLDGIAGESQHASHKGEIEVLSWAWGMSQSGSTHIGGGGGSGTPNFQDISLVKLTDKSTVKLMEKVATGDHVANATLVVQKVGGKGEAIDYIKIEMTNVIVTSVSTSGSQGAGTPTESISLNFAEFCTTYTETLLDGSNTPHKFCFDIAANQIK